MKDNLVNESGGLVNDCISRQAAIKDAESWGAVDEYEKHLQKNVVEWLKEFPAAELGTNLAEVGTDCISRQAAIDAALKLTYADGAYGYTDAKDLVDSLENLPSAQPEIIHCKDCRWWDKYSDYDNGYCMAAAKHGYFSKHWEINIMRTYRGNFYCADAEPKGEQA